MHLRFLGLQNFRTFDEHEFEFARHFTLLSGGQGSGKTAVLDALSVSLGGFLSGLGLTTSLLRQSDVRQEPVGQERDAPLRLQSPVSLVAQLVLEEKTCLQACKLADVGGTWERLSEPDEVGSVARRYARELIRGRPLELPVLAYYKVEGSSHSSSVSVPPESVPMDRLLPYRNCLDLQGTEQRAFEMLQRLLAAGPEDVLARTALRAIVTVLTTSIGDSDPVRFEMDQQQLLMAVGDERSTPWSQRGSAFRRVAALHADLAYRCVCLNPHHGEAAPQRTEGVVLIDELEAHLHPRWQRYLIEDLRHCFPRIQFIATTCSPFIIQSLHNGELIDLDGCRPTNHSDLSIEDITEQVLGIHMPQRSKRFQDMYAAAQEYMKLLARGADAPPQERKALKARLDELTMPFSDNPGFHAILALERIGTRLDGDDEEEEDE